ncbi:MAG: DDE-type integrase/transposase/recombinase, partial [bacterium]|nr:DDE-type integrase/transposase/recombinase [bacterium]
MRAYKIVPWEQVRAVGLSRKAQERLVWIDWYHTHGKKVRLTLRHFALSPDVFYRWLKRFNEKGIEGLEDDLATRRPHIVREMTTPKTVIDRIKSIREKDVEKSKYEIQAELRDEEISCGTTTIQKVINRDPKLLNIQHKKRVRKHRNYKIARIKAAIELREKSIGSLVQVDTKYFYVLGKKFYIFSAIDCKSRYAFIYCYKTISSASGKDFIKRVREYFPFQIQAVNTDNGSEYLLEFHKEITSWGIPHFFTDPHCPKQNGRVERFHQTAEYEYFNYQYDLLDDIGMINEHCMKFNYKYNNLRYHHSLGYKRPADYVRILQEKKGGGVTVSICP